MFDMNDPNTFWLNVTNIALGLVTLICCVAVGYGVIQEVLVRSRKRKEHLVEEDDHALLVTDLGLTMADGGERVDQKSTAQELVKDSRPKPKRRSRK